ncbi:CbiX/SirB N-terminal domain-containing protein [uncultured Shimia sp.]|uniref:CbiX/SirB N-terminal domain-containing protein n=1 Tax=uncultured Shimia sp. TaxID=573152 RepID=UPI0026273E3E|nr:CbiX/SirB N-terminal domain-containing protein [uncultured Shimia sp.]
MSGTRSHFPKAQATDALIVAHGQPSDPLPAEAALGALCERVQALLPDMSLTSATMANGDALEKSVATLRKGGLVYPLFMANGWFVQTALRKRLGDAPCHLLTPLGLEPALPGLAAQVIRDALQSQGQDPRDVRILLAAHGSAKGRLAAKSAYRFARALSHEIALAGVFPGFVEQAPFLTEVLEDLREPSLCLPFFAMDGDHMKQDVRQGLREAGFAGEILPALGQTKAIPQLIANSLKTQINDREAA